VIDERLEAAVVRAVGSRPLAWQPVSGGYTATRRGVVRLEDGRSVFVKAANEELDAGWLRAEHRIYTSLRGDFLPKLQGFDDDGEQPVLVLDDLSGSFVVPPWSPDAVAAVRAALDSLAATAPPDGLPRLDDYGFRLIGWMAVAKDPEPFLSLRLCTPAWLDRALPALVAASESCVLAGEQLLHADVRSDNIAIVDGRALLVDWNWACVGNARFDVAGWLPSLALEGGPADELFPEDQEAAGFAAVLSGFWAANAAHPPQPTANPDVRDLQRRQLVVALDWAAAALRLPAPSG